MRKIISHLKGNWIKYVFETAVVVIGILGAYSLNDWNEQRNLNIKQTLFLESIASDLSKDTLQLSSAINSYKRNIEIMRNYLNRIYFNGTIDTVIQIARFEWSPPYSGSYTFNNSTFQSLVSSGDIGLLDNVLINKLMDLDKTQSNTIKEIEGNETLYQGLSFKFNETYPYTPFLISLTVGFNDKELVNNHFIHKMLWSNIDHKHFISSFMGTLYFKFYITGQAIESFERLKEETDDLLIEINRKKIE